MPLVTGKKKNVFFLVEDEVDLRSHEGEEFIEEVKSALGVTQDGVRVETRRGRDLGITEVQRGIKKNKWGKTEQTPRETLLPEVDTRGRQYPRNHRYDPDTEELIEKAQYRGHFGRERD
jgi:hypothetical protein